MRSSRNPLAIHNLPENAMEEVLALQSYLPGMGGVDSCPSSRSVVVQCPSNFSGVSGVVAEL